MRKYGIENFSFEIIEGPISNYNEREIYWISYYNSYLDKKKGYNMTPGGEDPPIIKGEDSYLSKYSDKTILCIQKDLISNIKAYDEISEEYNISKEYLSFINRGISRFNENFDYPLRLNGNEIKTEEIISQITYDLLYTTSTIEEIKRNRKISDKVIREVNRGVHKNCILGIKYPIRKPLERLSYYIKELIKTDLLLNKLSFKDIAEKYSISTCFLSRFNQGKVYKEDNFEYPLRPSNKRVYNNNNNNNNPVETIPS